MKTTGPSNPHNQALVSLLDKGGQAKIWRRVAYLVNAPLRKKKVLNVDQLNSLVKDGEIIVVPSKILGSGVINKKITIGALNFSNEAKRKIAAAGGTPLSIIELWEKHPKGTNVRIIT